ncbi:MAG: hypothetical protein AABZ60_08640, partial [Planctomycetota bacterium]
MTHQFPPYSVLLLVLCCFMSENWAESENGIYLRWEFTAKVIPETSPELFWYFQKSVSLESNEKKVFWRVELPQRMQSYQAGLGKAEIKAHQQYPQQILTHLYFLCGILYLDECIVIGDLSGVLGLNRKDGTILFDYSAASTESDFLFFDEGTFQIQYRNQNWTGRAKSAKFLTRCENYFVYFNRKTLILFKISPYELT